MLTATVSLLPVEASATPTATSEPIVHVVEAGDTLYSIAFDYGVSPEALQIANKIENPQLLQIGQELTIPQGQDENATSAESLLPTPTPAPLEVQGTGFYETPVGSLWCLGEVINTNEIPLTNVQVRVVLFDAAGDSVVQADGFVAAELLPSEQRSPFGILFTDPPADWTRSQVSVIRGEAAGEFASRFIPITVTETDGQTTDGQFKVAGTVENAGTTLSADSIDVVVTTYDEEETVTGFRQEKVVLEGPLAPGESAPFSVLFSVHGGPPADFNITAAGRAAQ